MILFLLSLDAPIPDEGQKLTKTFFHTFCSTSKFVKKPFTETF